MKKLSIILLSMLLIVAGCKKDEDPKLTIDKSTSQLTYHGTEQLKANVNCTWISSDTTVAIVSKTGLVTAEKIGSAKITAKASNGQTAECTVTVNPRSNLFKEPIISYGSSISYIKSNETRVLDYEDSESLGYLGENNNVLALVYLFDASKLYAADVILNEAVGLASAKEFIEERYAYADQVEGYPVYVDENYNLVYVNIDPTLGLNIMYLTVNKKSGGLDFIKKSIASAKRCISIQ